MGWSIPEPWSGGYVWRYEITTTTTTNTTSPLPSKPKDVKSEVDFAEWEAELEEN